MKPVHIIVPSVINDTYTGMFDPVIQFLEGSFADLGVSVELCTPSPELQRIDCPSVVIAPHELTLDEYATLPTHAVLYNFEQLGSGGTKLIGASDLTTMAAHPIWDYSTQNIEVWKKIGPESATHAPLGHHPSMTRNVDRGSHQDIDVLFYGSINSRRKHVLTEIARSGLRVGAATGVYGEQLAQALARARLVINLHFYEAAIMEIVRLSHLWVNEVPVLTEFRKGAESFFAMEDACPHAPYDELAARAVELLGADIDLQAVAATAHEEYRSRAAAPDVLRGALGRFASTAPTSWDDVFSAANAPDPVAGVPSAVALPHPAAQHTDPVVAGARAHQVDDGYYGFERPELIALVPADARRILDVGCAAGALGAALKRQFPTAEVCGVEVVQSAVDQAAKRLDHAVQADLNGPVDLPFPHAHFDTMIFGDVLEHLLDPAGSLRRLLPYLAPNGKVVASIPNVKHWSVLLPCLVLDQWRYTDAGLLDRTHVHLFTLAESLDMFRSLGLRHLAHIDAVTIEPEEHQLLDPLVHAASQYGADRDEVRRLLTCYQYLIVAQRTELIE